MKPKNDVEVRVYEVLSHKNWGASSTLMNEIAQDTFDYERCELPYYVGRLIFDFVYDMYVPLLADFLIICVPVYVCLPSNRM